MWQPAAMDDRAAPIPAIVFRPRDSAAPDALGDRRTRPEPAVAQFAIARGGAVDAYRRRHRRRRHERLSCRCPANCRAWCRCRRSRASHLARVEDVIAANLATLFPGCEVAAAAAFRITRDADVVLQDDEEIEDLLHAMEEVVLSRRRRNAVRLTLSARPRSRGCADWLTDWLKLGDDDVYEMDGPQEASALMELAARHGFDDLKDRRLAAADAARPDRGRRSLADGPGPRRAAVSSLRELRAGGEDWWSRPPKTRRCWPSSRRSIAPAAIRRSFARWPGPPRTARK